MAFFLNPNFSKLLIPTRPFMVFLLKWMYSISRTRNKTDLAVQNFIIPSKGKRNIFKGFELDAQTLKRIYP